MWKKYVEKILGDLTPGSKIQIKGKPHGNADRVNIDICEDADGNRILFHFNPRFSPVYINQDANVVVRNTLFSDGWGHEERHSNSFPFVKDKEFKVDIWCENDRFHVAVDDTSFIDFKYRVPLELGRFVRTSGAVDVIEVSIKT